MSTQNIHNVQVQQLRSKVDLPIKFQCLFQPKRYKVLYGGRGGGKSWGIATALLSQGTKKKLRILCGREFQNSIGDSVHKLLSDQVIRLGLEQFYTVQQASICGVNGTEFLFSGLRHNAAKLKSFEAVDIAWIEEAQNVSKNSWEILIPTIRADDSEIWVSFNPDLEEDETYQRFVVKAPENSFVAKINYNDNPWFPEVLKQEMQNLRIRDMDSYLNIYEGHCRQALAGAVYANELREAQNEGRIRHVPYNPAFPVTVFADLGWADNTSLVFIQKHGIEYHVIKTYQNRQQKWQHYLQYIQSQGYVCDTIWLPHDARAKSLGTGKSIEEITKALGYTVRIAPQLSVEDGINAVRSAFPVLYIDDTNCSDGLYAWRRYKYEVDEEDGTFSRKPVHDEHSHFADALRYFAVSMVEKPQKRVQKPKHTQISLHGGPGMNSGWMK